MRRYTFLLNSICAAATLAIVVTYNACGPGFNSSGDSTESLSSASSSLSVLEKGHALYRQHCQTCHLDILRTTIRNPEVANINKNLETNTSMKGLRDSLSVDDVNNISMALKNPAAIPSCNARVAGFVHIRRLNNQEYNNVIRDLFGIDSKPANNFPADSKGLFYTNTAAALGTDMTLVQMYFDTARSVLDAAFSQNRQKIVTCSPDPNHRACAEKVIKEFGYRAFRRPVSTAETTQFLSLYDSGRSSLPSGSSVNPFDEALKQSLQAMMISPQFLYQIVDRSQVPANGVKRLDPYELASRLSFFIWGSIPDDTLLSLAANGTIRDPAVLTAQVDRMLKDWKSNHLIEVFAFEWLKLEKFKNGSAKPDSAVYPEFNDSLRNAMLTETKMLLADIVQKDGSPYLLVNANYTYVNQQLASHYGFSGVTGTQFQKVSLADVDRSGILAHGSVLTATSKPNESSIVHRGLWAMERMFCAPPGPPPDDTSSDSKPEDLVGKNPQQILEAHTTNPRCATCHDRIDPIGISLEGFDGTGKPRTKYSNGDMINTQGQLPAPDRTIISGAKQLGEKLTKGKDFGMCISRHLMNFSLGRDLTGTDLCAAELMGRLATSPTSKFSELVKAIVTSDQFTLQAGGQ